VSESGRLRRGDGNQVRGNPPLEGANVAYALAALDARLRDQRQIYLRGTRGTLASKPVNAIALKYLLTGLTTCGVCGGSFGPRLAVRVAAPGLPMPHELGAWRLRV